MEDSTINYLEICQSVRLLGGAQGNGPISVVGAEGYEGALVKFVRDAYTDIQNLREDFKFLRSVDSGFTVVGQSDYTREIKSLKKNTVKIQVDGLWRYIPWMNYDMAQGLYLNTEGGMPLHYSEVQHNIIRLYPTPTAIWAMEAEVQERPEILTLDAQVPKLPLSLHNLIVYEGLKKFSVYLGTPEIYREYATEAMRMKQELMSLEVPQKSIKSPRFLI